MVQLFLQEVAESDFQLLWWTQSNTQDPHTAFVLDEACESEK